MPRSFENERGFLLAANGAVLNPIANNFWLKFCAGAEGFMCPDDRIRVPAGDPDAIFSDVGDVHFSAIMNLLFVNNWIFREHLGNSEVCFDVGRRTRNIIQGLLVRHMVLN